MGSGNFHGAEYPHKDQNHDQFKQTQMCVCGGGASLQDIRFLIREEFEDAFKRLILPHLPFWQESSPSSVPRSQAHQAESSASKRLYLRMNDESLPDTLFTMNKIIDQVDSLTVELVDDSGHRVEDGPESSVKIKFVVLNGDFEVEDNIWTEEDFNKNIVQPRKDKPALLKGPKGKCEISLIKGFAHVGDFSFTDNSKRSNSVRLAAQVVKFPPGVDIRAAVSRDFTVKERRLLCDKKHPTPSPDDDLWRLKNISRVGQIYERAKKASICKVKDFLQLCHTDSERMRNILGVTSDLKWKEIVQNAEACLLDSEFYKYYDNTTGTEVQLDCAFNITGVSFGGEISQSYESLNDNEKQLVDRVRYAAYEKRSELEVYTPTNHQMQLQATLPYPPILPPMTLQPINVTAVQQENCSAGDPVPHPHTYMEVPLWNHDGNRLVSHGGLVRGDSGSYAHLYNIPTPELEWEEFLDFTNKNISPSKFKAAYYVTKAANIFMIAIQKDQNESPLKKKRKASMMA